MAGKITQYGKKIHISKNGNMLDENRRIVKEYTCYKCGQKFIGRERKSKITFCKECYKSRKLKRISIFCKNCDKKFEILEHDRNKRKFCCLKCHLKYIHKTIMKAGKTHPRFGKHFSEKSKNKMRKSRRKIMTKEFIKKILTRNIPTSLETKFQNIIDKNKLPYKYVGDGSLIIEHYNPDFINTNSKKIAVEVYAKYYKKRNNLNIENWKKEREKVFKKYGWELVFFDETQVQEKNILSVLGGSNG